ncbi:hypothetical protein V5O48_004560 [Marasmius crinis-equi]|uniref:DUF6535 domain-containing protein n=1 Tax=Marasmius crinis-equi TaxID=585013 RepID=A0ABR3FPN9_9AGAR
MLKRGKKPRHAQVDESTPHPTKAETKHSWEKLTRTIGAYDDEMVDGWKEEIDTLLVFAGLFSAVVTSFTVEFIKPKGDPTPRTKPSSDIRISTFWVISLILSLSASLFGLLCKQWFRHHQRHTPTRSATEAFTLRWLRNESLKQWGVPTIVASLPLLLELALLLFFAGLLQLVWEYHRIPYAFGVVVVGLSASVFCITTILPALTIVKSGRVSFDPKATPGTRPEASILNLPPVDYPCPFKSPQAWFFLQAYRTLLRIPDRALGGPQMETEQWSSIDLSVVRKFDKFSIQDVRAPRMYRLLGLKWMIQFYGNSPSVSEHVKNILLGSTRKAMVIPGVFEEWKTFIWGRPSTEEDILERLEKMDASKAGEMEDDDEGDDTASDVAPPPNLAAQLLYYRLLWSPSGAGLTFEAKRKVTEKLYDSGFPKKVEMPFLPPFWNVSRLWREPLNSKRSNTGLRFLEFYKRGWDIARKGEVGYVNGDSEQRTLVEAFADHLLDDTPYARQNPTALIRSDVGLDFLSFINDELITRRLYEDEIWRESGVLGKWARALDHVQEAKGLKEDYFKHMPTSVRAKVDIGNGAHEGGLTDDWKRNEKRPSSSSMSVDADSETESADIPSRHEARSTIGGSGAENKV